MADGGRRRPTAAMVPHLRRRGTQPVAGAQRVSATVGGGGCLGSGGRERLAMRFIDDDERDDNAGESPPPPPPILPLPGIAKVVARFVVALFWEPYPPDFPPLSYCILRRVVCCSCDISLPLSPCSSLLLRVRARGRGAPQRCWLVVMGGVLERAAPSFVVEHHLFVVLSYAGEMDRLLCRLSAHLPW